MSSEAGNEPACDAMALQDGGVANDLGDRFADVEKALEGGHWAVAYRQLEHILRVQGVDDRAVWLMALCEEKLKGPAAAVSFVRTHRPSVSYTPAVENVLVKQLQELVECRRLAIKQAGIIAQLTHGIARLQSINDSLGEAARLLRGVDRSASLYQQSDRGLSAVPSTTRNIHVLYVSGDPASPSHEYRVQSYMHALALARVTSECLPFGELEPLINAIPRASIVVFWRCPLRADFWPVLHLCRLNRTPIVFDVDDYVFEPRIAWPKYIDGVRFLAPEVTELYYWGIKAYRRLLLASDASTVTTKFLADRVAELGRRAYTLPNSLDADYAKLAEAGRCWKTPSNVVTIGYAPGSKTHQRDFAECADALAEVLMENPNVQLMIVGLLDLAEFPRFSSVLGQVDTDPTLGRKHLRSRMEEFDINIAPVELGNPFTESKSELKYFEAAALGIPTIASSTEPFRDAIEHGINGYLATTSEEWKNALDSLVKSSGHRRKMGEAARMHAHSTYGPAAIGVRARRTYAQIIAEHRRGAGLSADALTIQFQLGRIEAYNHRDATVMNLARGLADLGHHVQLLFAGVISRPAHQLRAAFDLPPSVAIGSDAVESKPVDVIIAASAEAAHRLSSIVPARTGTMCYLVQDYDIDMGGTVVSALAARASYRLALPKIAVGAWIDAQLRKEGGAPVLTLSSFFDHRLFLPKREAPSSQRAMRIVALASGGTTDRLVAQALNVLSKRRVRIELDIVGDWLGGDLALPHRLHGVPARASRAALFQQSSVGLVASSGAPLPFTFELMACAVPVVEVDVSQSDRHERYYGTRVALAAPTPGGIADALMAVLGDLKHWSEAAQLNARDLQQLPDENLVVDQLAQFLRRQVESQAGFQPE